MFRTAAGPRILFFRRIRRIAVLLCAVALLGGQSGSGQSAAPPAGRFVVVLDAAHGGADAGSTVTDPAGKPNPEKNLTLTLSVKLRSLLAARGIAVVTTRESDATVDAGQRAEIANHALAQACLSLHAAMSGAGVHLFISSLPAARSERFQPWQTTQAAFVDRSLALAGVLNSALQHAGMTVTLGRTALTTVDSMACPAVAVEIAPEQPSATSAAKASVEDPAYLNQVADALAAGLLEWRAEDHRP